MRESKMKINENLEYDSPSTFQSYQFTESAIKQPPTANLKIYFGKDSNSWIQFYTKNPPNRFQRWLCYKCFRITLELLK
jgi:hypothetical protein